MAELKKAVGKRSITDTNLLLTITIVVFAAMYLFAMFGLGRGFLRWQTFFNILNTNASLIITAIGLSIVMICGSIDISVGGVVGLVTMCCAVNLDYMGGDPMTALLISLGIGLAFGVVQGFLVAYLEIQPFIVTLAGMFFARGLTTIIHAEPFNVENAAFLALKDTRITIPFLGSINNSGNFTPAYMEIGVAVALVLVVLAFVMLRWTSLGRSFYALGGMTEVEEHFRILHEELDLPIFAYDIPVCVHNKLDWKMLLQLGKDGVLEGVKDSSGDDISFRFHLRKRLRAAFLVLAGDYKIIKHKFLVLCHRKQSPPLVNKLVAFFAFADNNFAAVGQVLGRRNDILLCFFHIAQANRSHGIHIFFDDFACTRGHIVEKQLFDSF